MVSLFYQLVLSLLLIIIGTLFYRLNGGKRPNVAIAPSNVTYRVRNIPARYGTQEESQELIEAILSTPDKPCTIKVRSFATDIDHATRILTFHLEGIPPPQLKPNAKNEWEFRRFDDESQQMSDYLIIDTHFDDFSVIYTPNDADHDFDLIAISGLGSHAWGSFKKRRETSMWLADKLPWKWPRARIMIYGYQSPIMGAKHKQTLQDIAKTFSNNLVNMRKSQSPSARCVPLVFLAHSLGGLVVKQALVNLSRQSRDELEIRETFQSVYAMLFFGVPCKGLDSERLGLAAMAKEQPSEGFISDFRQNAPMVDKLAQEFLDVFDDRDWVRIYSFYETVESRTAVIDSRGIASMTGPTKYWVGKDAAFNGRDIERRRDETYSIPIHTDHSSLVKCDEEKTFTTISNVLKGICWSTAKDAIELCKRQGEHSVNLPNEFRPLSQEEEKCMASLGPSDYFQDKDFNPKRIEGTCEWFLNHHNFTTWHEKNASSLLWVSGDPGCGKSVLSKYLIDEKLQGTDAQSTCFYFFKDLPGRNNATTAVKAILHQLCYQQPALLKYPLKDFVKSKSGFTQTFDTYWAILLEATKSVEAHSVVCILDALDECQESGLNIIEKLNSLYKDKTESSTSNSVLKFLVTSRPYYDIERKFVELTQSIPTIRLAGEKHPDKINREINLVIDFRVGKMQWTETTKTQIRKALCKPLNRTYLWVVLVFDVLESALKVTPKNVASIIDALPKDLEATYEAMLSKGSGNKELVRRLLHIVLCAKRPLTLAEMNIALNITNDCRTLLDIDRQETPELLKDEIRNLCGLFLSVVDSKVYLIHQTAKDFLLSKPMDTPLLDPNWKSTFLLEESNKILAEACISYLLFSEFEYALQPTEAGHDFLDYSAKFWTLHFREAKGVDYKSRIAESAFVLYDMSSKRSQIWRKIWDNFTDFLVELPNSLICAAYFGHTPIVERLLLDKALYVEMRDKEYGQTPLSRASENGHEAVVKLLLEKGAELETRDDFGRTPLSWASKNGYEAVVKLLLEKGAKLETKDTKYSQTPLSWASENGHKAVVKLLLENGAKLETRDKYGRTPLSRASENEHEAVVKLLLEIGAELETRDDGGQTPLSWASENGHEAVVKLLLEKGAELETRDDGGWTPLSWASENGHEAVVKLLLEKGAELETRDNGGRTPLSRASRNGYETVVKLLVEKGAKNGISEREISA